MCRYSNSKSYLFKVVVHTLRVTSRSVCRPALDIAFPAYDTLIGHYNPHGTDYLKKELNGVTKHQFHIRFKHTHLEYSGTPPSPPERPYEGQQSSHSVDKTVCPKSADMSAVSFSTLFIL